MTITEEQRVEAIARALCVTEGSDPNESTQDMLMGGMRPLWTFRANKARDIIAADPYTAERERPRALLAEAGRAMEFLMRFEAQAGNMPIWFDRLRPLLARIEAEGGGSS